MTHKLKCQRRGVTQSLLAIWIRFPYKGVRDEAEGGRVKRLALFLIVALIGYIVTGCVTAPKDMLNCGRAEVWANRPNLAILWYDRAIRADPGAWEGYFERGGTWLYMGRYSEAVADVNEAIKRGANEPKVYLVRGLAYTGLERFHDALSDFDRLVEMSPTNAVAFAKRGGVLVAQAESERALPDLNHAIQLDPACTDAYFIRGSTFSNLGSLDSALADFNKVLDLTPTSSGARIRRAMIYQQQGKAELATLDFEEVIKQHPHESAIYGAIGLAYYANGNDDLAEENYSKALELNRRAYTVLAERSWLALSRHDGETAATRAHEYVRFVGWKQQAGYMAVIASLGERMTGHSTDSDQTVALALANMDKDAWVYQIIRYLHREISAVELLAMAKDMGERTEVHTYVGFDLLLSGKRGEAAEHLRWVVDKGAKGYLEYPLAVAGVRFATQ